MSKINNIARFTLEILWLAISLVSLGMGIYRTWLLGISESYPFFIISVIAILMFTYRRYLRRLKKQNDSQK